MEIKIGFCPYFSKVKHLFIFVQLNYWNGKNLVLQIISSACLPGSDSGSGIFRLNEAGINRFLSLFSEKIVGCLEIDLEVADLKGGIQ